jgi:guanylate kinase
VIEARLDRARAELAADQEFDVVVVNDDVRRAAAEVVALLSATSPAS